MSNSVRTTALLVLALALLIVGTPAVLGASAVPEIDPTTGVSALTLISGAVLIIRARRKK